MALPLNHGVSAGQLLLPRRGVPYVVGEWGFPPSLLAAPGFRPGPEEFAELLGQLRVLAGLPKPVPPAASVPLAPPPPRSPGAVDVPSRQQAGAGSGSVGVKFRRQLGRVADFSASHGRLPSTGRGARADERRLGMWLYRQRRRQQDGTATGEETVLLAQALGPGWAGPSRRGPGHHRRADGAAGGARPGAGD